MGENTKIEWTDKTFNPVVGCTKISPACDHCYAESWAKRTGSPELWQGDRRRTTAANWREPLKWNREAAERDIRYRVFCASLADVFDNAWDVQWRADLFGLIRLTPNLDWQLLTKRIGNAQRMIAELQEPGTDWWPLPNVWLGSTIANQEEADRDIPKLLATPARVRFLSMEPLLGPVDLGCIPWSAALPTSAVDPTSDGFDPLRYHDQHGPRHIDWCITGGESGGNARPSHPDWFRAIRDACAAAGVAYLHKQNGEWAPGECAEAPAMRTERTATLRFDGRWDFSAMTPRMSAETHRDDEPDVYRLGKKAAGRMLDGRVHDEFPQRRDPLDGCDICGGAHTNDEHMASADTDGRYVPPDRDDFPPIG